MKVFKLIIILQFVIAGLIAQTVPQGMNYQAVARDAKGKVLANQDLSLQVKLTAGPDGKTLYSEIHDITTNKLGLFDVVIGQGFPESGTFDEIKWSENEIWMNIAQEENGTYSSLGNSKLWTVPYAMHAGSADSVKGVEGQQKSGAKWSQAGNNVFAPSLNKLGSTNHEDVVIITNNTERMRWEKDGDINISNNLEVTGDVSAATYYGDGSNLTGINVDDADADPTNELQSWSTLPGIPTNIDTDATDDFSGSYNDLMDVPSDLADGDDVDDADADPTNELQSWNTLPGIPVNIDTDATDDFSGSYNDLTDVPSDLADGDDVDDADNDPANELQSWNTLPGIPTNIDTDATDDFSGSYNDLTDVPTDQVDDADSDPTNELQSWSTLPGIPTNIDTDATDDFSGSFNDLTDIPIDQVDDADSDPTNELQSWSTLPGIPTNIDTDATDDFSGSYNDLTDVPTDQVDDADSDPTNELELPTNPQDGTIAYYNAGAWQVLAPGTDGQVMTMNGGVPAWAAPSNGNNSSVITEGVDIVTAQVDYLVNTSWVKIYSTNENYGQIRVENISGVTMKYVVTKDNGEPSTDFLSAGETVNFNWSNATTFDLRCSRYYNTTGQFNLTFFGVNMGNGWLRGHVTYDN